MAAAAILAATSFLLLAHINGQVEKAAAHVADPAARQGIAAIRDSIVTGYWTVFFVGAGGTFVSLGCIWWIWRTLGRVLRDVAAVLQTSSGEVLASADRLWERSQNLADQAQQAAVHIEQTSSSVEELAGTTTRNAEIAGKAKQLAKDAHLAAETGAVDMQSLARDG